MGFVLGVFFVFLYSPERQKTPLKQIICRPDQAWAEWEFAPFSDLQPITGVSLILIDAIFADNNCKYNLTNYFTHNILYMKS